MLEDLILSDDRKKQSIKIKTENSGCLSTEVYILSIGKPIYEISKHQKWNTAERVNYIFHDMLTGNKQESEKATFTDIDCIWLCCKKQEGSKSLFASQTLTEFYRQHLPGFLCQCGYKAPVLMLKPAH